MWVTKAWWLVCAAAWPVTLLAGCEDGSGSLALRLQLPQDSDLRPAGMTTVTITATLPGESPISTTSSIVNSAFTAGDLPAGNDAEISVVLRDVSNRIVGVGKAGELVDIANDTTTEVAIPVRRPFVYAADGDAAMGALVSFDPTRDARDTKFQGTIVGANSPKFMLSVGGDRLAIVTTTQVLVVATDTNAISSMITLPGVPNDAAAVPGTSKLAVATSMGITIIDIDTKEVTTAAAGAVDRVTVGPSETGALYAYGLVGRVTAPPLPPPMGTCSGSSSLVAISVDNPISTTPKALGKSVSDLAASPDVPGLYAALPCDGQVAKIEGDPTAEIPTLTFGMIASVERVAALTIDGNRIWAAGTKSAVPNCLPGQCTAASVVDCNTNSVAYADVGASLLVASLSLDGKDKVEVVAPDRRETIADSEDPAGQHAQVLKAISAVPRDIVTLPGAQYVAVVADSRYFIQRLTAGIDTILPCLDFDTSDWMLFDFASASIAQRTRTYCDGLIEPNDAIFPAWECAAPPEAESSTTSYRSTSVGALFGVR